MKIKACKLCVLIFLVFYSNKSIGQDNYNMWYQYLMSTKLEKSNLTLLSQYRAYDLALDSRVFLVSGYYDYEIKKNIKPAIGLMYLNINSYRDNYSKKSRDEIRPFQQITMNFNSGKVSFSNRFRVEERFLSNPNVFILRARYLISMQLPINKRKSYYALFKNEIRLNLLNDDFFDSDRITLGLGNKITKKTTVEISYINQIESTNMNHYAFIGFRNQFDWRKKN